MKSQEEIRKHRIEQLKKEALQKESQHLKLHPQVNTEFNNRIGCKKGTGTINMEHRDKSHLNTNNNNNYTNTNTNTRIHSDGEGVNT